MRTPPSISSRKADHIALCTSGDVGFRARGTLLDEVELIHDALPELRRADIDLSTTFADRPLRAPLLFAAMTGGVAEAERINKDLASVAEELGLGFAFGSQRPLLKKGVRDGFFVRDVAPTALLLGNIGVVQARDSSTQELADLVGETGVNALVVHLNPAMELVQPEGDVDFRGGLDTITRLVAELPVPLIVKETGCGLSRSVGQRLVAAGVRWVDTSGAGGTSWVAVETLRAQGDQAALGDAFWDWGIPTAASVAQLSGLGLGICATGGLGSGMDVARALALGATAGGIARRFLQAHAAGGRAGVLQAAQRALSELAVAHLLCGAASPEALRQRPLLVGPTLRRWVPRGSPLAARLLDA